MNKQIIYAPSIKHIVVFFFGPPLLIYSILLGIHFFHSPVSRGFCVFMTFPVIFFELLAFSSSTFRKIYIGNDMLVTRHLLYHWKSKQIPYREIEQIKDDLDIPGTRKAIEWQKEGNPFSKQLLLISLYIKLKSGSTVELEFYPNKVYKKFKESLRNHITSQST